MPIITLTMSTRRIVANLSVVRNRLFIDGSLYAQSDHLVREFLMMNTIIDKNL